VSTSFWCLRPVPPANEEGRKSRGGKERQSWPVCDQGPRKATSFLLALPPIFSEFSSARLPFPHPLRFICATYAEGNQHHSPTTTADLLPPACGGAAPQWVPLDLLLGLGWMGGWCCPVVPTSTIFCGAWFLLGATSTYLLNSKLRKETRAVSLLT
jgi:hypothetical protein